MDAEQTEFRALGRELRQRDAADPRQRGDRFRRLGFGHEQRLDQVAGFDRGLGQHRADTGGGAQAAEAEGGGGVGRHGKGSETKGGGRATAKPWRVKPV